jgi:hypothetical protein
MSAQYFAQLNENNVVINVHVVTAEFMAENPDRYAGTWVETFVDRPDKQYAGINFIYDYNTQNFVAPEPPPPQPLPTVQQTDEA